METDAAAKSFSLQVALLAVLISLLLHLGPLVYLLQTTPDSTTTQKKLLVRLHPKALESLPRVEMEPKVFELRDEQRLTGHQQKPAKESAGDAVAEGHLTGTMPDLKGDMETFPNRREEGVGQGEASTIFDPRLRAAFQHSNSTRPSAQKSWQVLGQDFYHLGGNTCIKEVQGGFGVEDRNSEAFLMYNVRRVDCQTSVDEGTQIIQALKAALD